MEGWISLHKKMIDWEWYQDQDVKDVFIHCLFRANFEDTTVNKISIKRGQFITSLQKLSEELNIPKPRIRTAINKLKLTHEIACKTTHHYTLINVDKYDNYQDNNLAHTQKKTRNSTTDNKDIDNIYSKYVYSEEEKYDKAWLDEVLKKCDNLPNIKNLRGERTC